MKKCPTILKTKTVRKVFYELNLTRMYHFDHVYIVFAAKLKVLAVIKIILKTVKIFRIDCILKLIKFL